MFKLFGKGKEKDGRKAAQPEKTRSAGRNQNELMYTTIVASQSQKKLARRLMVALESTEEVVVESRDAVIRKSRDKRGRSEELLEYMRLRRVTGVVILSSEEMKRFLDGDESIALQITQEDAELDPTVIANAFKSKNDVKSKILIVVPKDVKDKCSSSIGAVDVVPLDEDNSMWGKDIIAKFMKKIQP